MLVYIGIFILRLLAGTWRYSLSGSIPDDSPSIIAFWHEHMLPGWHQHKNKHTVALVSQSKDGGILAQILEQWGIRTIRGSSSQSGKEALAMAIEELRMGYIFLITPDGPRGPRNSFKAGAVIAAQRAEVPLYLAKIRESRAVIFQKSWDKFRLPLPFSTIHIEYIKISISQDRTEKEYIDSVISKCESFLNGDFTCTGP